jgi:hypothetical protein
VKPETISFARKSNKSSLNNSKFPNNNKESVDSNAMNRGLNNELLTTFSAQGVNKSMNKIKVIPYRATIGDHLDERNSARNKSRAESRDLISRDALD